MSIVTGERCSWHGVQVGSKSRAGLIDRGLVRGIKVAAFVKDERNSSTTVEREEGVVSGRMMGGLVGQLSWLSILGRLVVSRFA